MEKLQKWCLKAAAFLGAMLLLVLTVCSWCRTKTMLEGELLKNDKDSLWGAAMIFLGVLLLAAAAVKAEKYLSASLLHIAAAIFSLAGASFGIILSRSVRTYAVADQWYVYEAARRLAEGTFDITEYAGYYQVYSFQLNLARFYALVFKIVGDSGYRVLQTLHSVCAGVTLYMGFRIVRELCRRRAAEVIYLALGISFIPMYLYVLYIYGETLGVCFAMTAVWCFLKMNRSGSVRGVLGYGVLGTAAVTGFCQVRVALTVVWIGMLLIQIMITIVKRKPLPLVMTVCMILVSVGVSGLLRLSMERSTGVELDQSMPASLWVAMGLQESTDQAKGPGSYNAYNWNVFALAERDTQAASKVAWQYIKDRLSEFIHDPQKGAMLFGRKAINQWNEPTYAGFIMTRFCDDMEPWVNELYYGEGNARCLQFLNRYQAVVYAAVLLGFIRLALKEASPLEYLPGVILIGEFCFSMIWEANSRYVYPYAVLMIPFAACSLAYAGDLLLKKGRVLCMRAARREI